MKKRLLYLVVVLLLAALFSGFQANKDVLRIGNIFYSSNNVQIYFTDSTHIVDATEPFATIDNSPLQNVQFEQLGKNSDYPVTILFLVDKKKNNYFLERSRAKQIIERFMDGNDLGEARMRTYFVMPFGERVESAYNPQENPKTILHDADHSDYFAALSEGIKFLAKRQEDRIREYQAIVLISDGSEYTENTISKLNLKNELREYGIPVFAVVHNDQYNITPAENVKLIREFTDISNGTTQRARDYNDENKKVAENIIVEMLRSYVLTGALQSDYIGLNVNPEDSYSLTLRFGTRGSETASTVKKNAKIRGLYEDVMNYFRELTAVAQTATAEFEATQTSIAQTATAEFEATQTSAVQTATSEFEATQTSIARTARAILVTTATAQSAAATATAAATLTPPAGAAGSGWIHQTTAILGYEIPNKILIGIIGGLLILAIVTAILFSGKDRRSARVDEDDWNEAVDDLPPTMTDSVPDYLPNNGFGSFEEQSRSSCNISFENMDRNRMEAPIRESISNGEEKTFGRRAAEGVIGLNGDGSISKVHFKLAYVNGTLYIEDMASSNGVVLNGNRIQTRARLKDGDILLIGKTTYRVHLVKSGTSMGSDDKTQLYF